MTMPALAEKSPPGGGYTLVEMVVVLAVMALAAAVIAPGLFRSETSGGERVVRTLTEVYAMAREAAVTRGGGAQVWVNADEGRWLALVRSGGTSRWDTLGSGSLQTPGVRLQSGLPMAPRISPRKTWEGAAGSGGAVGRRAGTGGCGPPPAESLDGASGCGAQVREDSP